MLPFRPSEFAGFGAALALWCVGCGRSDDLPPPTRPAAAVPVVAIEMPVDTITPPPADLPCFSPDSGILMYGEIAVSPEDQDASGVAFSFQVTPAGMIGTVVDARGGVPPPKRLQGLHYNSTSDTLVFWYASGTKTKYIYAMRPSCDSLWGTARLFVTDNSPGQRVRETFRRNR
jgi:hypothetical protein